ncbi:MAG: hypothetical protein R2828_25645 [Saprospiraceae bacterium]
MNNNEIETRSDSVKVYKNLIRVKLTAPFAVSSFDFRIEDDSVIDMSPKANFITTHDTHRFKESGKFAFIRLINPQSGIYDLQVVSTEPINNILNHFEGHWNNNLFRFDKK